MTGTRNLFSLSLAFRSENGRDKKPPAADKERDARFLWERVKEKEIEEKEMRDF